MRNEFEKYAKSEFGIGTDTMYDIKSSMTPMVYIISLILL